MQHSEMAPALCADRGLSASKTRADCAHHRLISIIVVAAFAWLSACKSGVEHVDMPATGNPVDPPTPGDPDPDNEPTNGEPVDDARIYPTVAGGREWTLPSDAQLSGSNWQIEGGSVSSLGDGVFRTEGEGGQVRLSVRSLSGEAWWRNVEMTAYFRYAGDRVSHGQERHFELIVRGEGHWAQETLPSSDINDGNRPPAGTATWPGYPYSLSNVNAHCLGSSYHGNIYLDGSAVFEKELTHIAGYSGWRGTKLVADFSPESGDWFGMKFVVRNAERDTKVRLELWMDVAADGTWRKATEFEDGAGIWPSANSAIDGCTAAPYSFSPSQVISWAGPWVIFRSDSILLDFRGLTVREIAPLP